MNVKTMKHNFENLTRGMKVGLEACLNEQTSFEAKKDFILIALDSIKELEELHREVLEEIKKD